MNARAFAINRMGNDAIHSALTCHLGGFIRAAIIDDQPFHFIKSGHRARQFMQRALEGLFLVVAWDLDNKFHAG